MERPDAIGHTCRRLVVRETEQSLEPLRIAALEHHLVFAGLS
jgi:hypothetical protein